MIDDDRAEASVPEIRRLRAQVQAARDFADELERIGKRIEEKRGETGDASASRMVADRLRGALDAAAKEEHHVG